MSAEKPEVEFVEYTGIEDPGGHQNDYHVASMISEASDHGARSVQLKINSARGFDSRGVDFPYIRGILRKEGYHVDSETLDNGEVKYYLETARESRSFRWALGLGLASLLALGIAAVSPSKLVRNISLGTCVATFAGAIPACVIYDNEEKKRKSGRFLPASEASHVREIADHMAHKRDSI